MISPLRLGAILGALALALATAPASTLLAAPDPAPAPPADAARLRPPDPSRDPVVTFERYRLGNGLEVVLAPDNTVPLVAVDVWYHVAAGNEVPGRSGFAHLFEHMLFQGSQHVGNDRHFAVLREIGVSVVNGTTNNDRTNYFEVVPSNQLEAALWLESDRMGYLLPSLTEASLKNQIEVVRNERRQRVETVPYGKADVALYEALYPAGHPYKYAVIGLHEDLAAAKLDDVTAFFKTWYVPSNATLTVAGDFDVAEAKRLVERWFGSFPASQKPRTAPIPMPVIASRRVEISDEIAKLRQVRWAWHTPARYAAGDAELEIAGQVLGRVGTGRLYKLLVHDKQLAQSVSSSQDGEGFSGNFDVTVTLRTGADAAEAMRITAAEIERLAREPITDAELRRVVVAREAASIRNLEGLLARAEMLQTYNHFLGDPGRLSWDLDRYRNATPESVRAAVATYLRADRRIEVVTTPKGATP